MLPQHKKSSQLRSAPRKLRARAEEAMVGIFSRFSAGAHRRSKSVAEVVETLAPNMSTGESDTAAVPAESPHGIEVGFEFKPVERPVEPVNLDQPLKCPLPEPSILHDGRIWKEKMSSVSARVRTDLPVVQEGSQLESDSSSTRSRSAVPRRAILPSVSAPEHNIRALLDECDVPVGSAE
ncbi:hypothetical protein PAHAL_1G358600 [Panicum hallii]|uniref:Uncharacterized protein n=1 Tax=Panicum hallii TaxID=206008 RepID=A0A2S3GSB6_9POAL|nr:uncharacterized protein LOC112889283 [Panicum hallii]PAN07734.1 hypothetical protein PAHAL_1G358600 [Panicum hallii]